MSKKSRSKVKAETIKQAEVQPVVASEPVVPVAVEPCLYCGNELGGHSPFCVVALGTTDDCETGLPCHTCTFRTICVVRITVEK